MKKTLMILTAATAIAALTSCSRKTVNKDFNRVISVRGTGEVSIPNEKATISLSVITRNKEALAASQENAQKMEAIHKVLKDKLGLTGKDLATCGYSLRQDSHWQNTKQVYDDYVVSNELRVFVKDVSKTGEIIDLATRAGANRFNSIQFSVEDTKESEMKAREEAAKDAKKKAEVLAQASGAKLGKLVSISEGVNSSTRSVITSNQLMYAAEYDDIAAIESYNPPTEAGNSKITVTIEAVYEIK